MRSLSKIVNKIKNVIIGTPEQRERRERECEKIAQESEYKRIEAEVEKRKQRARELDVDGVIR